MSGPVISLRWPTFTLPLITSKDSTRGRQPSLKRFRHARGHQLSLHCSAVCMLKQAGDCNNTQANLSSDQLPYHPHQLILFFPLRGLREWSSLARTVECSDDCVVRAEGPSENPRKRVLGLAVTKLAETLSVFPFATVWTSWGWDEGGGTWKRNSDWCW